MPDDAVTLFKFESDDIKVSIEAYFDSGHLVVDGYDIGRRVEEYWGDSDYEYMIKVPPESVKFFYKFFSLEVNDERSLLQALARRFNNNSCYSDIRQLLDENKIEYEGFTWT